MNYDTVDNILWPDEHQELRDTCEYCGDTFPVSQEEITEIDSYMCCTKCYSKIIYIKLKQDEKNSD